MLAWPFQRWLRDSGKKTGLSDGKSSHVVHLLVVKAERQLCSRAEGAIESKVGVTTSIEVSTPNP